MSKPRRRGGVYPQKVRCKAHNRHGEQCRKWAMKGSVVCNKHGGAAPQVRRKAQERIAMAQDDAASLLVKFMGDKSVPYAERRRCAEFLLTYENRNAVTVTLQKWEQDLEGVIVEVVEDEVVDAELVVDEPPDALPAPHAWDGRSAADVPPTYPRGTAKGWGR